MTNDRILVVDDEKGVVRSCTRILEREGFDVSGRTESSQVPDLLRQETFDLLLTDIKMPKIDGLKLLKIAKEIDPHLTVVLITGYGTMEDAIEAISLGAQGFLMKPFEPEDLIGTIKENLRRRA
ncbi:MAG: response regulator, partial [Anaerolineae bacterium]|nr:response regulator [Anaerolineae bacterium]